MPPNLVVDVSPDNIPDDSGPRSVSEAGPSLLLPGAMSGGTVGGPPPMLTAFGRDVATTTAGTASLKPAALTTFIPPTGELGLPEVTPDAEFLPRSVVIALRKDNVDASPGIDPKSFDRWDVPEAGLSLLLPSASSGGTTGGPPPISPTLAILLPPGVTPPNV